MSKNPRWQDSSTQNKVRIIVMGVVQIALLVAALWDIRRRPATAIRGRKATWVAIAFINFAGPIAYFVFGRRPTTFLPEEVLAQ